MATQVCLHITLMTACVEWLAGLVVGMEPYGVVVERQTSTAAAQRKIKKWQQTHRKTKINKVILRT